MVSFADEEEFVTRENSESGVFVGGAEKNCGDEVYEGVGDCHGGDEDEEYGY